jgi:hypothetical protein
MLVGVLGLICVITSPLGFSQTKDGQTKDGQTRDRRLEDAQADIRLLKRVVDEQARRITQLEKAVKVLEAAATAGTEKPAEDRTRVRKPPAVPRWQVPDAWTLIKTGMSRMDVEAILGPPTSVDSVIDYQTLYYKGAAAGGDMLSGTVKLTDDRVSQVDAPDF